MVIGQFGGWYLGMTIATVILVVVVAIVASLLTLAGRIAEQAILATEGLEHVGVNTRPLSYVEKINASALAILNAAQQGRAAAGG